MTIRLFHFALPAVMAIFMSSCGDNTGSDASEAASAASPDPAHNSQNALDWAGRYQGILPCADCEGIQTSIELKKDYSYTRRTMYLGKSRDVVKEEGRFEFTEDGNHIELGVDDRSTAPYLYKVIEGALVQMDLSGNPIKGELADSYILKAQPASAVVQSNIKGAPWKLKELNGKPIQFNDTGRRPPYLIIGKDDNGITGFAGCNNIFGQYELKPDNQINFGRVGSTKMMCEHMRLETEYLSALESVSSYILEGGDLYFNNVAGKAVARFEPFFGSDGRR